MKANNILLENQLIEEIGHNSLLRHRLVRHKKIAKREWLEVVEVFTETLSAKEPGRPKFNEMMKFF